MNIDHICFAVRDTEEAVAYWEKVFGYRRMTKTVANVLQRVLVTFMKKEGSLTVKLIEPVEGNTSLLNFISRDGGFHHICFRCDNVSSKIEELKQHNLRLLTPPQPGEAFNNHDIAFMMAKYGMNIELIDTDEKASLI
jgi:methylmalonyl-CoA/ethylmalonyl-CoA epimerase